MKAHLKIPIMLAAMVFLFLTVSSTNSQDQEPVPAETNTPIKSAKYLEIITGEEILVIRDIGKDGFSSLPIWCGNNSLIFYSGKNIGMLVVNFITKKSVHIKKGGNNRPLNCTSDGRFVIYTRFHIIDLPMEKYLSLETYPIYTWHLYRYDITTEKEERLGTTDLGEGGWFEAISPDASRVLFGKYQFPSEDKIPAGLEGLWFTYDWEIHGARWFPDSSGIIKSHSFLPELCVELFGIDGFAKCFDLKMGLEFEDRFFGFMTDKENRIYFHTSKGQFTTPETIYSINRCEIKNKKLYCKEMVKRKGSFNKYNFLPNGDLIYSNQNEGECIRSLTPWEAEGDCLIGTKSGETEYSGVWLQGVSPDGKWLLYTRSYPANRPNIHDVYHKYDLFAVELKQSRPAE